MDHIRASEKILQAIKEGQCWKAQCTITEHGPEYTLLKLVQDNLKARRR